jgi:hypothetical protein
MIRIFVIVLIVALSGCKHQEKYKVYVDDNPFGRIERWLNAPSDIADTNRLNTDSIWDLPMKKYREWLLVAKVQLNCLRQKAPMYPLVIQSFQDIEVSTSLIRDSAIVHGCATR